MKKVLIVVMVGFGILALAFIGLIVVINMMNWITDRTLAKNLTVTKEWAEINIDPPVTPTRRVQELNLRIDNFKVDRNSKDFDLKLPDGTIVEPEIELYDEYGNKFEFHRSGFVMKTYDDIVFTPGSDSKQYTKLPVDKKYTKIRTRSEIPFACDQIYWRDYNPG